MSNERKIRLSYIIFTILLFSIGVLAFSYQQMADYFHKDLISYDECTNAVVSNNLYRDNFPPKLRLNSLTDEYQGWKEGPDWQHIPPLFSYVPFVFYFLDGEPTIEVRRYSYLFIAYLQGIIFIIGIFLIFKQKRAVFWAAAAAYLWIITPFTRGVLNANYFGYSDIVLAFTVTLSLLLTILVFQSIQRKETPVSGHLLALAITASALPVLTKNVLGALPWAFLVVVMYDGLTKRRIVRSEFFLTFFVPLSICAIYYGANLWKSPEAFKASFFVSFQHFGNFEGWKKPFHYFVTNYYPKRYFQFLSIPFLIGFIAAVYFWWNMEKEKQRSALYFFLTYFAIHLVVISIVTSKSANFALQSYLFLLFFVLYVLWDKILDIMPELKFTKLFDLSYKYRRAVGITTFTIFALLLAANIYKAKIIRTSPYNYNTQNEKFFQFGELSNHILYGSPSSLFILDTDEKTYPDGESFKDPDFWMRYYIMYHSGAEARRIEEVADFKNDFDVQDAIRRKYKEVFLVTSKKMQNGKYANLNSRFEQVGSYQVKKLRKKEVVRLVEGL